MNISKQQKKNICSPKSKEVGIHSLLSVYFLQIKVFPVLLTEKHDIQTLIVNQECDQVC